MNLTLQECLTAIQGELAAFALCPKLVKTANKRYLARLIAHARVMAIREIC